MKRGSNHVTEKDTTKQTLKETGEKKRHGRESADKEEAEQR
jgi:hypothetical protein